MADTSASRRLVASASCDSRSDTSSWLAFCAVRTDRMPAALILFRTAMRVFQVVPAGEAVVLEGLGNPQDVGRLQTQLPDDVEPLRYRRVEELHLPVLGSRSTPGVSRHSAGRRAEVRQRLRRKSIARHGAGAQVGRGQPEIERRVGVSARPGSASCWVGIGTWRV